MGLIDQAKADIETITSNSNDFGKSMILLSPFGDELVVIGLHTKHHLGIDNDGNFVNSKNAHISVSEKFLTDAGYPVRINGEVNLSGHRVKVADSTGVVKTYSIDQWFPNETVGLITCILGTYDTH